MSLEAKELFKEKNVWAILCASRGITLSKINVWIAGIAFSGLLVFAAFTDANYLVSATRDFAKYWLPVGLNTLGFLVSGFAIYTALGKPGLFLRMDEMKHEKSGLTWLKYVMFVFMEVLIFYVLFAL